MTNFVDTVFNTSATGNVIKYRIKHSDSTTEDVEISCITPITTLGTALNKAFFDTIQADFTSLNNNKLNVSAKATQGEAEAGTNDTKYMTPLKVKQEALKILETQKVIEYKKTSAEGHSGIDLSQYLTEDTVKLDIYVNGIHDSLAGTAGSVTLSGSKLWERANMRPTGDMSRNSGTGSVTLASGVFELRLHLEIINTIKTIYVEGTNYKSSGVETLATRIGFNEVGTLTLPTFSDHAGGYYNLPYPITIIQYKK